MKSKFYFILFSFLFMCLSISTYAVFNDVSVNSKIKYDVVELNNIDELKHLKNSDSLYTFGKIDLDLRELSVKDRKKAFVEIMLPTIEVVNSEIIKNKQIINTLSKKEFLTEDEQKFAQKMFKKYRVPFGKWNELQRKLIIYPTSLILSQGAVESGWGTSRFFRQANNAFGICSFNPNESRIAPESDSVPTHFRKYNSLKDCVSDLVYNISVHNNYKELRKLIHDNVSVEKIAQELSNYSEEGPLYVQKVLSTMSKNDFQMYD